METEITPIAFSEETKTRAELLTSKYPEQWLLLSEYVQSVVTAIAMSGNFFEAYQDTLLGCKDEGLPARLLGYEQKSQETLLAADITDDATANQWLAQIESKLLTARSEYQKISDRHKQELEEFCKQWRVS